MGDDVPLAMRREGPSNLRKMQQKECPYLNDLFCIYLSPRDANVQDAQDERGWDGNWQSSLDQEMGLCGNIEGRVDEHAKTLGRMQASRDCPRSSNRVGVCLLWTNT